MMNNCTLQNALSFGLMMSMDVHSEQWYSALDSPWGPGKGRQTPAVKVHLAQVRKVLATQETHLQPPYPT